MRPFILLILFFATSVFPQNNDGSLYKRGLQACLEKEAAAYSRFSDRDLRNVNVLYDFALTRDLPTKLGDISIRFLTNSELVQEFKKLPKDKRERGIPYMKIFPIRDKDDRLFFAYNNYWFTYSEKGGFFSERKLISSHGLEGGCRAEIGIDAIETKFIIKGVELSGF
jgi:hypothetical protein